MKKLLVVAVLIIVIGLSFGFVYFKSQALGRDDNYFNTHLRAGFAKYPIMREILGLHYDGDASADYLGQGFRKIEIEVDVMNVQEVRLSALEMLAAKIESITGKPTDFVISDKNIPYEREVPSGEIASLANIYRSHKSSGDTAAIYLLYLSRDKDEPKLLGRTYQEYGMVLYGDELAEFTKASPDTLANYEESTALHEFGHLLGLPHNDRPDCLMNSSAEQSHVAVQSAGDVVVDFCGYEKGLIGK